jgi:hypothetical protein
MQAIQVAGALSRNLTHICDISRQPQTSQTAWQKEIAASNTNSVLGPVHSRLVVEPVQLRGIPVPLVIGDGFGQRFVRNHLLILPAGGALYIEQLISASVMYNAAKTWRTLIMGRPIALVSLFVIFTVAANAQARAGTADDACGRECLRGFITQYLDAMIGHDPNAIPTDPTVRFTEDTKTLPLGEGLWKGASKIRSYRQDFLDVREGVAASHVVVEENGAPVMLALRLKIENRKITEIETMVIRSKAEGALFDIEKLTTPHAAMNVVPEASQRMSRDELIRIAEIYAAGLKVGGNFDAVNAPFAPDAYRIENGTLTAGPGARAGSENIRTQRVMAHPDITYRIAAVDEEMGIVLFRLDFGNTNNYGPGNALTLFEAFKIYGGQIHAVEAFMDIMPENTPSGWPNYEVKKPK